MKLIDAGYVMKAINRHLKHPPVGRYEDGFNDGLNTAILEIMAALTLTPPSEWVSVEDALPPNMDDVLVVVQNNGECWTVTGYYSNTSNVWYAMLNGQDTQMDVLWWMPFPAPPDRRPPEGEANE